MSRCVIVLCRRVAATFRILVRKPPQRRDKFQGASSPCSAPSRPINYRLSRMELLRQTSNACKLFELLFIAKVRHRLFAIVRDRRESKGIVYLRAHWNGYLVVTGRNSFTYGGFYDARDEKEGEGGGGKEGDARQKENYSRLVFHTAS